MDTEALERIANTIVSRLERKGIKAKSELKGDDIIIRTPEEINDFSRRAIQYEIDDDFVYNGTGYTIASDVVNKMREPEHFGTEVVARYTVEIEEV